MSVSFEMRASSAAELGEPHVIHALPQTQPGDRVELDLAASTTDTFKIASVKEEGAGVAVEILPLTVGRLPVVLHWKTGAGPVQSPPVVLEIRGAELAENPQLRDIAGPLAARAALWPWLLALAAAAVLYWLWRRRRPAPAAAAAAPADLRPAHARALDELAALERSGLWAERRYKDFYIQLTDILRRYLEARWDFPAPQLTTGEIWRSLREAEVDRDLAQSVKALFDRADLVKFAKTLPDEDAGGLELAEARGLVERSAPLPAEPAGKTQ